MSLFDIIKYPVNDIFDTDELDKIPNSILKEWIGECASIASYGYTYTTYEDLDWGVAVLHIIHGSMLMKRIPDEEKEARQDVMKDIFTQLLRQRIKEYNA